MARIKTSDVVQGIAGMSKNHLYSCWKGVGYLMSKPVSLSNPRSPVQQSVRAYTTFLSRAWYRNLTDAQRAGWNEYAQQQGSAAVNTAPNLGGGAGSLQVIPQCGMVMSGYNAFIRNNFAALEIGIPPISPPVPNAPLGIDAPNAPTNLRFLQYCSFPVAPEQGCTLVVAWEDPLDPLINSIVRIWLRSVDAGVHRQVVGLLPLATIYQPLYLVKAAQGAVHLLERLPGHYLIQMDCVDTYGQRSPPSNTITVNITSTCPVCP